MIDFSGDGHLGKGYFGGCNRALNAATEAVHSVRLKGAGKILVNITTGPEVTLGEMYDAVRVIEDSAGY